MERYFLAVRVQLKNRAAALKALENTASKRCYAIEIALRIQHQAALRKHRAAVGNGAEVEVVKHFLRPGCSYFIHRARTVSPARAGCAVEIALRILDQTTGGKEPVHSWTEAVQHRLITGRSDLKHCPAAHGADAAWFTADFGRAIKIALPITHQIVVGLAPVLTSAETIERGFRAGLSHLKHGAAANAPAATAAAVESRPIQVSLCIQDQPAVGKPAVPIALSLGAEGIKHAVGLRLRRTNGQ